MKIKTLSLLSATLILGASLCQQAQATPITGSIAFSGTAMAVMGPPTVITPSNPWFVVAGSGDYAVPGIVPAATATTFAPISYTGTGVGAVLSAPGHISPLWTFTLAGPVVYSFNLLSLTSGTTILGPLSSVAMSGTGVAKITGRTDTIGTWSLSGSGVGGTLTFAFSTTTASGQAVPEGGLTIAFLGSALVGLGMLRRRLS